MRYIDRRRVANQVTGDAVTTCLSPAVQFKFNTGKWTGKGSALTSSLPKCHNKTVCDPLHFQ